MMLSQRTLQCLREMINERTEYRSGPQLVRFFNALGCEDSYGQGFPSRWVYTDDRLAKLNGTPKIDQCVREVFSPANFVGRVNELDALVVEFNHYLAFDKWRLERDGAELRFKKLDKIEIQEPPAPKQEEDAFLSREFKNVTFSGLGLEPTVVGVLEQRLKEIERCYTSRSPLAVILLAGSTLEGVLLGLATSYPKAFNSSSAAPKHADGKVKRFQDWSLSSFIDVARDLRLVEHDTHKFSHSRRDFRNYIHPFEQMASGFSPREHTAKICLQVLRAAAEELRSNLARLRT